MATVILLRDGDIANSAEPWRLSDAATQPRCPGRVKADPAGFQPFNRGPETLARVWAVPGTPGLEHRIGGIEKASDSGNISYDPANHQQMTDLRRDKVLRVAQDVPLQAFAAGGEGARQAGVGRRCRHGPDRPPADHPRLQGPDLRQQ